MFIVIRAWVIHSQTHLSYGGYTYCDILHTFTCQSSSTADVGLHFASCAFFAAVNWSPPNRVTQKM